MQVSRDRIKQAIAIISSVECLAMDPKALVDDCVLLSLSFPDDEEYCSAVASTVRALRNISEGKVSDVSLSGKYSDWNSHHYQHRVGQGNKAVMRIIYRRQGNQLAVWGFGHRYMPKDIYRRISNR